MTIKRVNKNINRKFILHLKAHLFISTYIYLLSYQLSIIVTSRVSSSKCPHINYSYGVIGSDRCIALKFCVLFN